MLSDGTITLTPFRLEDAPTLMAIDRDPDAARWFDFPELTLDEAAHRRHAEQVIRGWWEETRTRARFPFAIRVDDTAIGTVELRTVSETTAALSYALIASERGRGYATRAVRLLAATAFARFGFERLEIRAHVDNVASHQVAARAGFVRESATNDELLYTLTR